MNITEEMTMQGQINDLKEENKRLRKDYNLIIQNNIYTLELEKRINKAISVIENLDKEDINVWQEDKYWAYVLYILKGDSNE